MIHCQAARLASGWLESASLCNTHEHIARVCVHAGQLERAKSSFRLHNKAIMLLCGVRARPSRSRLCDGRRTKLSLWRFGSSGLHHFRPNAWTWLGGPQA